MVSDDGGSARILRGRFPERAKVCSEVGADLP